MRSAASPDLVYEPKNEVDQPYFYVFNGSKGFVIVSGDDRAIPILGYSDDGYFDPNDIPPNMAEFLKGYQQEFDYLNGQKTQMDVELKNRWQELEKGEFISLRTYSPNTFLIKTRREQDYPYNQNCPENSVVGCYGIVMAQIICYWGRDMKNALPYGFGAKEYSSASGYVYVDFENVFYDYEICPISYIYSIRIPKKEML